MPRYRLLSGRHSSDGKQYEPGDEIELSEDDYQAFSDKFEPVEESSDGGDDDEYYCGVNDCGRTVDSPDATCWQH